jgi:hypothetical protein
MRVLLHRLHLIGLPQLLNRHMQPNPAYMDSPRDTRETL